MTADMPRCYRTLSVDGNFVLKSKVNGGLARDSHLRLYPPQRGTCLSFLSPIQFRLVIPYLTKCSVRHNPQIRRRQRRRRLGDPEQVGTDRPAGLVGEPYLTQGTDRSQ
jgi:hypothetical protein